MPTAAKVFRPFGHVPAKPLAPSRPNAGDRGYGHRWRIARAIFLANNPLCRECEKANRLTAAIVVDHVLPHRGNELLFWDEDNWQPLCKRCHDSKTGKGQ